MPAKRIQFLGLPLDTEIECADVCQLLKSKGGNRLVTFINPAAWSIARGDKDYLEALNRMSLVLPDGEGVALAARFLARENVKRISFDMTSLADPFFKEILALGASVALIGGKPGVTEDVRDKLKTHYAGLTIVEAFHGYGEIDSKIAEIIKIGAEVVIVGMGAPQQEIFLLELKKAGYAGMSITCGGFFDQYLTAEDKNYYPAWIDQWNLRFLYRLYREPKRLWRRYLIDYGLFIWLFAASAGRYLRQKSQGHPVLAPFEKGFKLIKARGARHMKDDKV